MLIGSTRTELKITHKTINTHGTPKFNNTKTYT